MTIVHVTTFRVTRNADLTLESEDADDLLAAVEMELRRRRFGRAVRLEVDDSIDPSVLSMLLDELELDEMDVSRHRAPLATSALWEIHAAVDNPSLKDALWQSVTAGRLAAADGNDQSIFSVLRTRDLLVHHPYESFSSSTEEFIEQAATDPRVQGIKITLYRTSPDSAIARSLIKAAEMGKQVVALIELTARFDEATNVGWAKELERVGVHVVYGVVGLKTHSKCVLVVRQEESGLRRYVHVGTGNYNSKTAKTYEDIGLFSCNEEICDDVSRLFNALTGFSNEPEYSCLIVAPKFLRPRFAELIENEISHGPEGHILMKMNALADKEIIELLYRAAEAGVKIDLIVRGICALRPGGESGNNFRIRSILGRYLEHSRMYRFAHGDDNGEPLYLIGSADMMPRNLDKRVEVLVPVEHPKHRAWMDKVFNILMSDDVVSFEMERDGSWARVGPAEFIDSHDAQYLIHTENSHSQTRSDRVQGSQWG
jgi:polyphosphate kinase